MIQPLSGNVKINRFTDNRLILGLLIVVLLLFTAIVDDKFDRPKMVEFYDGLKIHVIKTYENDIDSFLRSQNISLAKSDILLHSLSEPLIDSMEIRLIKVSEEITIEEEPVNFNYRVIVSRSLQSGEAYELRPGRAGLKKKFYKLTCHNAAQKSRNLLGEAIIEKPVDRLIVCAADWRKNIDISVEIPGITVNAAVLPAENDPFWQSGLPHNAAFLGIAVFPVDIIAENSLIEIEGFGKFIVKNDAVKSVQPHSVASAASVKNSNNIINAIPPDDASAASHVSRFVNGASAVRLLLPAEAFKKISSRKKNVRIKLI